MLEFKGFSDLISQRNQLSLLYKSDDSFFITYKMCMRSKICTRAI